MQAQNLDDKGGENVSSTMMANLESVVGHLLVTNNKDGMY